VSLVFGVSNRQIEPGNITPPVYVGRVVETDLKVVYSIGLSLTTNE